MKKPSEAGRLESDSMGEVEIPSWAYWGAQTQRALENFGVSPLRIPAPLIRALGMIKAAASVVNGELGRLDPQRAGAISRAAEEVAEGKWDAHFPVDVFQTGSGTSWNMNANEVIANRANEILGRPLGGRDPVHPNDHVNSGQSSNDVIPSAIHIANRLTAEELLEALQELEGELAGKAAEFRTVVKIGRTHLQEAVPMTLGQEFSGYATQVGKGAGRLRRALSGLEELALGATAVGTGINAPPRFAEMAIQRIAARTRLPFRKAANPFEALAARDAQVELMGALNTLAGSLMKIANDLRLLASGPRAGFAEILLPSLQPGSSVMPGKINPVIPEMVVQAAAFVMGKHLSVTVGSQTGPLELNVMMPLIAHETQSSLELLANTVRVLARRCIRGIKADPERCAEMVEWSLALVTPLAVRLGYDRCAELAYEAVRRKMKIADLIREKGILSEEELKRIFDPAAMIGGLESESTDAGKS